MAQPGEYTLRAFLNGKLDLSQAEAVADLIASDSEANHRLALHQLKGNLSGEIHQLREKLLNFVSLGAMDGVDVGMNCWAPTVACMKILCFAERHRQAAPV